MEIFPNFGVKTKSIWNHQIHTLLLMFQKSGEKTSGGIGSLSHYLQGFYTYQVVVWDFWTINSSIDSKR